MLLVMRYAYVPFDDDLQSKCITIIGLYGNRRKDEKEKELATESIISFSFSTFLFISSLAISLAIAYIYAYLNTKHHLSLATVILSSMIYYDQVCLDSSKSTD